MSDPTPAQIDAAARAAAVEADPSNAAGWDNPETEHDYTTNAAWRRVIRAALTAAAQVQPAPRSTGVDPMSDPTPAQIEAAARAINSAPWDAAWITTTNAEVEWAKERARKSARAALTAAAQVQPAWQCSHPTQCADAACSDNPAMQRTVTADAVDAAKRKADNDCPKGSTFWTYRFLAALGITVEAPRD